MGHDPRWEAEEGAEAIGFVPLLEGEGEEGEGNED